MTLDLIGSGSYGQFLQRACQEKNITVKVHDGLSLDMAKLQSDHVVIATPNHTHYDLAAQALNAGKHVLCEKPLALDAYEVEALITTARAKNLHLGVGFVLPNHEYYQWIKEQSAEWGGIQSMRVFNHATEGTLEPEWYWDDTKSGGWFMVAEIHWYHLFAWLTDASNLDVASARESKENGRTYATWSVVTTDDNQQLEVKHYLNMSHDTAWTKVEILFGNGTHLVIDDWVPRSLHVSDGMQKVETRSRDAIYQSLIQTNIERLIASQAQDPTPIYVAHRTALAAQQLANQA